MKCKHMFTICTFAYLFFCATPAYTSSHSNKYNFFSYPRDSQKIAVSLIPAFCVGSVLGTFWRYADALIPFNFKYVTTYPLALVTRMALVGTISKALQDEGFEHSDITFLGAAWLWEWMIYKQLKGFAH